MKINLKTLRLSMFWAGLIPLSICAVSIVLLEPWLIRREISQALQEDGERMVIAWQALDAVAASPEDFQRAILVSAAGPSIRSAALLRQADGLVLAASRNQWLGKPFSDVTWSEADAPALGWMAETAQVTLPISEFSGHSFRLGIPLRITDRVERPGTEIPALAFIEFDTRSTEDEHRKLLRPLLWFGFGLALVLIGVGEFAMIFWVVLPLERIAAQVRSGESLANLKLRKRRDEVGVLVRALHAAQTAAAVERTRLEENRKQLQEILEGFGDPVVRVDAEHNLIFLNRAARTRLGWDESSLSRPLAERITEETRVDFCALLEKAIADPSEVPSVDIEVRGPLMTKESAAASARAMRGLGGRMEVLIHLHLTTEQRRAEQALREREEIYSAIVQQAPDAIGLVEILTGRFVEFNQQAHTMLGYTREEFAGLGVADIEAEFGHDEIPQIMAQILSAGQGTIETRHRHRDGRVLDVLVTMRCLRIRGVDYLGAIWRDVTETKQKETQRRELALVVEQSPISIMITDLEGRIEYTNPHFTRVTGYRAEEVRGQNPRLFKSGVTEGAVFEDLWSTVKRGEVWRGELVNRRKDGGTFVELATITPIADEQGRQLHYVAIKQDITERRRIEAAMAVSEAKFRSLFDLAPLPLVFSATDGEVLSLNRQFENLFGYTRAEVPTIEAWFNHAYPDPIHREQRVAAWERAVREADSLTGAVAPFISEVTCHDGTRRTVEISAVKVGSGTVAALVDLTARLESERLVRQLSRAVEQAPLSIVITDLTGAIEYANPHFTAATGYTLAEVLGQNPRKLKSGKTPSQVFEEMWTRLNRGEVWRGEFINARKDGSLFVEDAVVAPISDEAGTISHYVALKTDITEQKQAAAELRASRDRLEEAERIAKLGHWEMNLETQAVTLSDAARAIYELEPADRAPTLELLMRQVHPADASRVLPACREALINRADHRSSHRLRSKTGTEKYLEVQFVFQRGADGQILRLFGTTQDVTLSKLVELELHALVKQLRGMHQVAYLLDHPPEHLGLLVEGVAGLLPGILSVPDAGQATVEINGQRHTSGAVGNCSAPATAVLLVNGQAVGSLALGYVEARSPDPIGVTPGEHDTLKDIARTLGLALSAQDSRLALQRFNAELEEKVRLRTEELEARNREMHGLLISIPDLVLHLHTDGTVLHCHLSHDSISLASVADPASSPPVHSEKLLASCAEAGARAIRESTLVTADAVLGESGRELFVELRAAAISKTEFVVFVRDISARKRQEADAAAMFDRERQVSEMKTRFISVTSHEFRTPMAAAVGSADLLHNHYDRLTTTKREELFGRISAAMQRMTDMLDDVLTMSRLDSDRVTMSRVAVDLPGFIRSAVEEIQIGDRDVHRFEIEAVGDGVTCHTDPKLLQHILTNLLSNAVRYSPSGSVVSVSLRVESGKALIDIADHGIGIPEADLPRIFEPFERAGNVGSIKGTGLGLSIVKRISDLLEAEIAVESAVGRGTRFRLVLPLLPTALP